MTGRASRSARNQPAFTSESSPAEQLAACKAYLLSESARIRQRHLDREPGQKIVQALAAMMDRLLRPLFDSTIEGWRQQHGEPPAPVCLIALGGYGRSELSPLSDVDVMFLFPPAANVKALSKFQEHQPTASSIRSGTSA